MSGGGGNKKKPQKTQGWEEAGSEFYQESYPADGEFDAIPRDPKHLATLLPSKQTRAVANTIRMRTNDNRTIRRQTSSRSRRESTVRRRTSTAGEVQVSMLPDLSENLSNEQTTWEEIMLIKSMPVPMCEKKEMKAKILNEPNLRLQGYEQFKWKRRKMWKQFSTRTKESLIKLSLWKNALKHIEGNFGTGVVTYFLFLKWLFFLNIIIFCIIFTFITLPTLLYDQNDNNCTAISDADEDGGLFILHLVQGTGLIECSVLFYGYYSNETLTYGSDDADPQFFYNLPLAYIIVILVYFGLSLICMIKSSAKGFRERLIEGEGQFYRYCNSVFGGWDFCINNEKSAQMKHKALYNEIKGNLENERMQEAKSNRTKNEYFRLILLRILINVIILLILIGCGCAIYYIFDISMKQIDSIQESVNCTRNDKDATQLFFEFLPSITIVCLNIIVPFFFRHLIVYENYSALFVVKLTLLRTVFLRLSSLIVLYASLYKTVVENQTYNGCNPISCWETYVGQQLYKLILTDFATHLLLTFFVNFPRALLAANVNAKFCKFIGEQTFDLPKHVLDIVYLQTLCWMSYLYAPLLSAIAVVVFFTMFYVKKFVCLYNCRPGGGATVYRASRSYSMFMLILLVSFAFAALPAAYSVAELTPSSGCGPFRDRTSAWALIEDAFHTAPDWLRSIATFVTTAGFVLPLFVVLILLLYYYAAVNSANRHMVSVLKNQLVLEGHDKQFLLERLSKFIKQQQENQKRLRCVEVLQSGDTND